jgi:hypothetical protein
VAADLPTLGKLAFRHLAVRRGRALLLLVGYAVGAAVMMVLLSVGEAMLVQSRDVALVGGGDVVVLPEAIDLESFRTGSVGGLSVGLERARFLHRQLIGGPRLAPLESGVSPLVENELIYLAREGRLHPLKAGGEIPSAARSVGSGLPVIEGEWDDSEADRRFVDPSPEALYHELDRFHPPRPDSTWGEWHYFNIASGADEWWYLSFLIGGNLAAGKGGGELLVTHHQVGRPASQFRHRVAGSAVRYDTLAADLFLGSNSVVQRDGRYRLRGEALGPAGSIRFDLVVTPEPNAYFPAVELESGGFVSGYVVPAVRGTAGGTICQSRRCRRLDRAAAYHDHNWGVWRQTTWNWGQARGTRLSLVYGGVIAPELEAAASSTRFFLAAVDSLGVRQVLRFAEIAGRGRRPLPGTNGVGPESFRFTASGPRDTLAVLVEVLDAQATTRGVPGGPLFLQMRGRFRTVGTLLGQPVADSGLGFFETFVRP